MSWLRRFFLRLVNAAWPARPERELDREVRAHLALLEADFVARGLSPDQGHKAAVQTIGGIDQLKEQHRDARSIRWVGYAWRDGRDALRLIRHHRRLAAAAILTIGLAVGAVTVVFGVFESVVPCHGLVAIASSPWRTRRPRANFAAASRIGTSPRPYRAGRRSTRWGGMSSRAPPRCPSPLAPNRS
jgi:hypothetical protein